MKVLAITGGIGAGKSTVARAFYNLGAQILDADQIAHEVLEPGGMAYGAVVQAFGREIVKEDLTIDRRRLAAMVFENEEALARLNRLTHPCVCKIMEAAICQSRAALVCMDVPLLFSKHFTLHYDKSLAVTASDEVRIARVLKRSGGTREEVLARMAEQPTQAELVAKTDWMIENNGDMEHLTEEVKKIYQMLTE